MQTSSGWRAGDGSQALVATVAMEHDVAHVCVPAGTRNHFALDLGLDRDDVVGALDAFTDGVERRIDLASRQRARLRQQRVARRLRRIVQSDAYRDAKLGTWKRMLPEMLGRDAAEIDLQFDAPQAKRLGNAALVIVSNNPYQLRRFGALVRGRAGHRAAGHLRDAHARRAVGCKAGDARNDRPAPAFRRRAPVVVRRVRESTRAQPVAVGLDGEALMLAPPLRFLSVTGSLRVLCRGMRAASHRHGGAVH